MTFDIEAHIKEQDERRRQEIPPNNLLVDTLSEMSLRASRDGKRARILAGMDGFLSNGMRTSEATPSVRYLPVPSVGYTDHNG